MIKKEDYQNKKFKAENVEKKTFTFTEYGIVIEAENQVEAEEKLKEILTKKNK